MLEMVKKTPMTGRNGGQFIKKLFEMVSGILYRNFVRVIAPLGNDLSKYCIMNILYYPIPINKCDLEIQNRSRLSSTIVTFSIQKYTRANTTNHLMICLLSIIGFDFNHYHLSNINL